MSRRVLVIKLGALGDVIQALGPMQAIRRHHADDDITLLTTAPYAPLGEACGWFDRVWIDDRPGLGRLGALWALRRRLRGGGFDRVYDLQTADRSGHYYQLMAPGRPEWSGIARGCSHPHANPDRDFMHTIERQAEQLAMAGIPAVPPPDLTWLDGDIAPFGLAEPFVLLAPGGAAHRPDKRWPAERYGDLAGDLAGRGLTPVVVGGPDEAELANGIAACAPGGRALAGTTSLFDLAGLGRRAVAAVGNDTGPMHLLAAVGCPCVVLYSRASDPALCAQRGTVIIRRRDRLDDVTLAEVVADLNRHLDRAFGPP